MIELCVRWYITYRLSYRDLVAMMPERGIWGVQQDDPSVLGVPRSPINLCHQLPLVVHAHLRQTLAALLKITNLNQSGP